MKHYFTILLLCMSLSALSQETKIKTDGNSKTTTVHSIKYTVNSAEELKTIDWNDIKAIFKDNKPEEMIEMAFEINLPESKSKFKSSFKVGGESKNIDSLIKYMKKGVKVIAKLTSEK